MDCFNNKDNSTFKMGINRFFSNLCYLLVSMPLGILYFTFAVTGISLGVGTSIIYIGIPILAITLICAEKIVELEKIIAVKILDKNINTVTRNINLIRGEGIVKRMIVIIKDSKKWKSICYCIIKLPISIVHFVVVTCSMTLSLGITFQPVIFAVSKTMGIDIYKNSITIGKLLGVQNPKAIDLFLCPILGIGITFISVKIINALAEKWADFTLTF